MTQVLASWVESGPQPLWRRTLRFVARSWLRNRSHLPDYASPTYAELASIEEELQRRGIGVEELIVAPQAFMEFQAKFPFPTDYHGGPHGGVFTEKLLEHYLAHHLLDLDTENRTPYIDVAACASPWAMLLRNAGIEAYAIDLDLGATYKHLPYYETQNATCMRFDNSSVGSASLQCAFEMFEGNDDTALIHELSRVLRPAGRAVILPLYMHTHPCHYSTPEWTAMKTGDSGSSAYVRRDVWGIRASRKYSPETLISRVLNPAIDAGLLPSIKVVRNAREIDSSVYLHFVLVLDKPTKITVGI